MICLAAAMVTGPLLVTVGPDADGGLAVVAAGTALLSLLVLARLYGLVRHPGPRRRQAPRPRGAAQLPGLPRPADRARQPAPVRRPGGGRARRPQPRSGSIAALFLDLDDFKTVNDSLGHAAGDELLVAVAARIRDGLRSTDVAARLGGDEFGVLLLDIPDPAYATTVAERLLAGISAPLEVAGIPVEVNASIGVAVDTEAMHGVDDLLSDADVAMYQAKALGKGRQHVFDGNPEGRVVAERPWSDDQRTVRRPALRARAPGAGGRLGPGHRTRLDGAATTSERRADAGPGLMKIPLFPLHTVLCPGIVVPLHIFEERYREMTRRCLDTGRAVRGRADPRGPRGRDRAASRPWPAWAPSRRSGGRGATRTAATTCSRPGPGGS